MNTDIFDKYPGLGLCVRFFVFLILLVLLSVAFWIDYLGYSFTGDISGAFDTLPFLILSWIATLAYNFPRFFAVIVLLLVGYLSYF
jgi:hypothetical protein